MQQSTELVHNKKNAVTAGISRVFDGQRSVVKKVLNGRNSAATAIEWRASHDSKHWNFWQREAEVYRSQVSGLLQGSGVRLPELLKLERVDESTIELTLEDVQGRSGAALTLADYQVICRSWGIAQARLSCDNKLMDEEWLSRDFIRTYALSKPVDYTLLWSDAAWQQPLVVENWPSDLRDKLQLLYTHREQLYQILASSTMVPCHLDFWPNNVFVDNAGIVVPVDWAFFGAGALAEDVGNFIPDAVFDGFMPATKLPEMAEALFAAYLEGLTAGGLTPDVREVQTLLWACAVKYVWLGPLLLQQAGMAEQKAYGGAMLDDANKQYRERGITLEFLCDWADRALAA